MSLLFRLPTELIFHSLSFVPKPELKRLFQLDELFYCSDDQAGNDPYLQIRQEALANYYSYTSLIITNNEQLLTKRPVNSMVIDVSELLYLISHKVYIRPREISYVLFNIKQEPAKFMSFVQVLFQSDILAYLKLVTNILNVQIVLAKSKQLVNQLIIKNLFRYLNGLNYRINWFKIRYTGEGNQLNESYYSNLSIENLQLHLFNSVRLTEHLSRHSSCLLCENIKALDLSFNALSDLSMIAFPPSLVDLNLSNNNLIELTNSNFNWKNLVNLQTLNLSNNSLIRIDLNDRHSMTNYKLISLDLSGNNLVDVSFLSSMVLAQNLKRLNLARNLVTHVSRFPEQLVELNLMSNYLATLLDQITGNTFPKMLQVLNLSYCKIGHPSRDGDDQKSTKELTQEEVRNMLVGVERLHSANQILLDGNNFLQEGKNSICDFEEMELD